ncbi:Transcription initiation factor TFIID subunit 6 [Heracleum sosnowskyi]|uniref:Transcription initiation factor TFIID subunit 6 n=1 Tax=Heracleum sosnowskyi TaxID=360622 RepID=A0AAD8JFF6_9APIA|nr:Transcription initiation factor TFIID subunit 6 [Heracleum sosnowskyi]
MANGGVMTVIGVLLVCLTPDAVLALALTICGSYCRKQYSRRRTTLTTYNIDSAFKLRNVEPLYGFASGDPLRFRRALGHKDLFYIDFKDAIEAPLLKALLDASIVCHWLEIEGVQPAIPENAPVEVITAPQETKKSEGKESELPVDIVTNEVACGQSVDDASEMHWDRSASLSTTVMIESIVNAKVDSQHGQSMCYSQFLPSTCQDLCALV